jgi:hypothetical protein
MAQFPQHFINGDKTIYYRFDDPTTVIKVVGFGGPTWNDFQISISRSIHESYYLGIESTCSKTDEESFIKHFMMVRSNLMGIPEAIHLFRGSGKVDK